MKENFNIQSYRDLNAQIKAIPDHWTPATLLAQEGLFPLEKVAEILEIETSSIKAAAYQIYEKGKSAFEIMGLGALNNNWVVSMEVFAPYYLEHLNPKVRSIPPSWDGNLLLTKKGTFFLRDVCARIPFNASQLRYQANKNPNSRKEFGIWKDKDLGSYLVNMETFGPWISVIWRKLKGDNF